EHQLRDPGSPLHEYLEPGFPITYRGYHAICGALVGHVGWRWAHRLTLTIIVLVFALGYEYLARSVQPNHAARLLGFGLALSFRFYMGFFDYLLASGMLFFGFGFVLRRERLRRLEWVEIGAAILATALVHAFVGAMLGVVVLIATVLRAEPKERLR